MFGIAVSSSSACVAARCAHARAGVGVVATQNITDPMLGPRGLDLLATGLSADEVLSLLGQSPHFEYRQVVVLDKDGRSAVHSGRHTLGTHAVAQGVDAAAAGNLLATTAVPHRMIAAFEECSGSSLGDRIVSAMQAALAAGGEEGPVRSAGMLLVDRVGWAVADLRVDWTQGDPVGELAALWALWRPQMDAYVTRALDPSAAPSFGVPGDR
jgi:uncharacterized Ntn-hydrolase superfamily protein